MLGTNTLEKIDTAAEVTNISPFGFWLLAGGKEFFVMPSAEKIAKKRLSREEKSNS